MPVTKKTVQLNVEINGKKAGQSYGSLIGQSRKLNNELYKLTPGTDAFIKKSAQLKKVNTRLARIRDATKAARHQTSLWKKAFATLSVAGLVAGALQGIRAMVNLGRESLKLFDIQAKADAQTKAAIISTNGAARKSFEELKKEAQALQKITLFGDEQTQAAQNVLLTFTKIQSQEFTRATAATLDMATALKVDLKSASIQVGKALNDPTLGVTALGRAGVQFTQDQKQTIKALQEGGEVAKAQAIILKELEIQFGGSAEAAAKAGTGAYTQFSNRIDDIKESIGLLIQNGLQRMAPFLDKTILFMEKFVAVVLSGEKATGEFAGAINFIIGLLKITVRYYRNIYDGTVILINGFNAMVAKAKQMEYIGRVVSFIADGFKFLIDIVSNTNAVFAGLKAGAVQAIDNIKKSMVSAGIAFQIFGKKAELFLSIKSSTKARLRQEIKDLQDLQADAAASGQTVGQAYREAYRAALQGTPNKKTGSGPGAPTGPGANLPETIAEISAAGSPTKAKAKTAAKKTKARAEAETADEISARFAKKRLEDLEAQNDRELDILEKKFLLALLTEEEYNRLKLEQKKEGAAAELEFLELIGKSETALFRKKELEKLAIEKEMRGQSLEDERRANEIRQLIQKEGLNTFRDIVGTTVDLLGKDEAARKKNAGAIKAFETARILVNSYAEISELYKSYAKLGILGAGLASIRAIGVGIRAGVAISKVNAAQFYKGGKVPDFSGQLIDHAQNIPTQAGGDSILATLKPGEVVLNEDQQAAAGGAALFRAIGVPGFNNGGLALSDANTTPNQSILNTINPNGGQRETAGATNILIAAVSQLSAVMAAGIEAKVYYNNLTAAATEMQEIQEAASL